MPTTPRPIFTIQTASLWASGDLSTFAGTGGPAAFDPFLGEFSGPVTSNGLATEPFLDGVNNVDAGDQVTFVIAVQNFGAVAGYDLKLRDQMPVGFAYTAGDILVTDGLGNQLYFSGNLFDPSGGLIITNPVSSFSGTSGANVVLITFTLQATSAIAVPSASITNTAQVVSYAASEGGPDLSGSSTVALAASTPVQTTGIAVSAVADQNITTLNAGQTASYDITVTLPEGTTQNLSITEAMPQSGNSWFQLVSAQVVQFGANLSASLPVMAQPNGSVLLGSVVDTPDNLVTPADTIVVRVTVKGGGTTAGQGTLNTVVSATNPNSPSSPWSTTVSNSLALGTPDTPPTIGGISPNQNATDTMRVVPFSGLILVDPDAGQTETLTIHLSNPALGTLGGATGLATNVTGDQFLTGPVAMVQAAVRTLVFTPTAGATGTENFSLTINDGVGGTASNQNTSLTLTAASNPSDLTSFPLSTQTVLTSTATGSSTYARVEAYAGALDNIGTQFLYDGAAPIAIVAQQSSMLISSMASATAVQLLAGGNVLNLERGSSFLTSGSGNDTIILHADQPQPTWNTLVNFHSGDSVTIYGFTAGSSTASWDSSAGAAGYTGATLRLDTNHDGVVDSSVTFTGKSLADTSHYIQQTGSVAGQNYLTIIASG